MKDGVIHMSSDPAQLIRSDDPRDRMKGIKMVARLQNERALRVLASLAENDGDAEVREFAKKGARYVAKKLDEKGALEIDIPEPEPEEELPAEPVEVSARDEKRAQEYVASAFSMHIDGDNPKAIQELTKALKVNPNLRFDQYFMGVASSVTGMESQEAVKALTSEKKRKGLADKDAQQKTEKALSDHMSTAERHTWGTLSLDIGILAAIVFLGMLFTILMVPYAGNIALSNQIQQAVDEEIELTEGVRNVTFSEEEREELATELTAQAEAGESVVQRRTFLQLVNFGVAILFATGAALSTVGSVVVYAIASHFVVNAMGGEGKMPYTVHNIVGAYPIPMLVMYGLLIASLLVIFLLGVPARFAPLVLAGSVAVVLLVISIRVGNRLRKSYYNLSFMQSSMAGFIAGIPSGLVTLLVYGLVFFLFVQLNGTLWQLVQETAQTVPTS